MRIDLQEDEAIEVQMAPLIDCVFLLLIFFLVASTLKKTVKELPLTLPDASAAIAVAEEPDMLVIAVDRAGETYIDVKPVTTELMLEAIRERAKENPFVRVRIDADLNTPYQNVIRVINELQFQGFTNVGLQTMDVATRTQIDQLKQSAP